MVVMPEDVEMLRHLSRMDEVEAMTTGDGDLVAGTVPAWCEVVLDIADEKGRKGRLHLTRADGELIIEVLHTVLHPNTHKHSPVERLWAELDDVMDFLMEDDDPEPEDKVRAKALATAIAMIAQPYSDPPDVDSVRSEAIERWESRQ